MNFAAAKQIADRVYDALATRDNWGYILAIRTGSVNFSKRLASGWVRYGFRGEEGNLVDSAGNINPVREERDLFLLAGIPWTEPENRT